MVERFEGVFRLLRALSAISETHLHARAWGGENSRRAVLWPLHAEMFHYPSRPYGPQQSNAILNWAEWKLRY
jgi:hypothetical protein